MQESFKESFLATSNTKLAAVYRFFELRLPRFNPAIVAEVFKWSDLKKGFKDPSPPRRVVWKFEPDHKAREITEAYHGKSVYQIWLEVAMRHFDDRDPEIGFVVAEAFIKELLKQQPKF